MNDSDSDLVWQCRNRVFRPAERPLIMGILNVTPDSFSDGGRYHDKNTAIEHGLQMVQEGADIIDVGGESTRPGAAPVSLDIELERVVPVIEALCRREDVVLSVDTMKSEVAERALAAGAHIINDVSALSADPRMADVAKAYGAGVILMHRRGESRSMQQHAIYDDVVREVRDYLVARVNHAERLGLARPTLAIDPGIGFGKTAGHNVELLAHLSVLRACGRPIVVGLSRKAFIGQITGREVEDRGAGTLGALAFCLGEGAQVLRVHDVQSSRDVVQVLNALLKEKCRVESR
ncbi:MAG: dihydropteroate synthase [Kiritimatiellae bacterium]|nr:dihydropteroate synthase [Kiritimatiellia bacterium]